MNVASVTTDIAAMTDSLSQWWALAGMDHAVDEAPRRWLHRDTAATVAPDLSVVAPAHAAALASAATPAHAAAPTSFIAPTPVMPRDLDAFLTWTGTDSAQPEAAHGQPLIMPHAPLDAPVMIVTDMPTAQDMSAGTLFAGEAGQLLRAMLACVNVNYDEVAHAGMLLSRPVGGIVDDSLWPYLAERTRHLIELIRPSALLVLGDRTSRALSRTDDIASQNSLLRLNLEQGTIPAMSVPALPIMLRQPELKAVAWRNLRRLAGHR